MSTVRLSTEMSVPPHHLQNRLAGHHKVGVLQQKAQQAVFFVGQFDRLVVHRHAVTCIVQQDLMEAEHIGPFLRSRPAQRGTHRLRNSMMPNGLEM